MEKNYRILKGEQISDFMSKFTIGELAKLKNYFEVYNKNICPEDYDMGLFYYTFLLTIEDELDNRTSNLKFSMEEFIEKLKKLSYTEITFLECILNFDAHLLDDYETDYYAMVLSKLKNNYLTCHHVSYSNLDEATVEECLMFLDSCGSESRDRYAICMDIDCDKITAEKVYEHYRKLSKTKEEE